MDVVLKVAIFGGVAYGVYRWFTSTDESQIIHPERRPKNTNKPAVSLGKSSPPKKPSVGARWVMDELKRRGVVPYYNYPPPGCVDKGQLLVDFQISVNGNEGWIEYDGGFHFHPFNDRERSDAKNEAKFVAGRRRDLIKTCYAFQRGIPLLRLADDLSRDEIVEYVGNFVCAVREGKQSGIVFRTNKQGKYDYLKDYSVVDRV